MTKRPFNKDAYAAHDRKNKVALIELMTRRGYELVGDLEEENFKKYDLQFKHKEDGRILSFENETRDVFDKIKSVFPTIHIPIRKKNTQADFYIVWNVQMSEFFLISREVIEKCKQDIVSVKCKEGHVNYVYEEDFLDIPKNMAQLFKKNGSGFWKLQS
jgi:hypothetical protein